MAVDFPPFTGGGRAGRSIETHAYIGFQGKTVELTGKSGGLVKESIAAKKEDYLMNLPGQPRFKLMCPAGRLSSNIARGGNRVVK